MTDVDAEIDLLYAADPGDFVAARGALAKRLRAEGERERAAEVAKLRRPTVVAWAVNQVARQQPDDVDALIGAGRALSEAQAEAVGGGDAAALRDAMRTRREVVRRLAGQAVSLLAGRGGGGEAHRDDIVATLESASLDPDVAEVVRRARLTRELPPPSGFGVVGEPPPTAAPKGRAEKQTGRAKQAADKEEPPPEPAGPSKEEIDAARKAHEQAQANAERLAGEADAARQTADAARQAADAARQAAERLTGEADAARAEAEAAAEALRALDPQALSR